jgi:hypothetical protein
MIDSQLVQIRDQFLHPHNCTEQGSSASGAFSLRQRITAN